MPKEYNDLLTRGYDDIFRASAAIEREMAARFRDVYSEVSARLRDLYDTIGDPPTLQEARRYNRLLNLQKAIAEAYATATGKNIASVRIAAASGFAEAAYRTEWALDQSLAASIRFPVIPVEAIRASVYSSESGLNFIKTMKRNAASDLARISATITRGLALGQGYAKTAREVKDNFNRGLSDAVRVIRTETHRNMTQGHLAAYDAATDAGVKMEKMWVATMDERTRVSHAILDGQVADADGYFHVGGDKAQGPGLFGDPAQDINCRCVVTEVIEGFEPIARRAGDDVIDYQNYVEWAEPRGWDPAKGWPLEKAVNIPASKAGSY